MTESQPTDQPAPPGLSPEAQAERRKRSLARRTSSIGPTRIGVILWVLFTFLGAVIGMFAGGHPGMRRTSCKPT